MIQNDFAPFEKIVLFFEDTEAIMNEAEKEEFTKNFTQHPRKARKY